MMYPPMTVMHGLQMLGQPQNHIHEDHALGLAALAPVGMSQTKVSD